jgi:uncharacterized membrane protein
MTPEAMLGRLYMDRVLAPRPSLPRKGFIALLILLAAYNVILAGFLLAIGAFPVPIFLGLDFVAVLIAFRASYRRAASAERVQVTAQEVRVLRRVRGGEQPIWTSPTAFTRVRVHRPGERESEIQLRIWERTLSLGRSLSPGERSDFADALERAIAAARGEGCAA